MSVKIDPTDTVQWRTAYDRAIARFRAGGSKEELKAALEELGFSKMMIEMELNLQETLR